MILRIGTSKVAGGRVECFYGGERGTSATFLDRAALCDGLPSARPYNYGHAYRFASYVKGQRAIRLI